MVKNPYSNEFEFAFRCSFDKPGGESEFSALNIPGNAKQAKESTKIWCFAVIIFVIKQKKIDVVELACNVRTIYRITVNSTF